MGGNGCCRLVIESMVTGAIALVLKGQRFANVRICDVRMCGMTINDIK
jgi:hypothetical protein